MVDDTEDQPKSIRDSIEEAIADVGEPEPDAAPARPAPRPAPEEKERDELDEGIEERPRDEKGRFLPRAGDDEEAKPEAPAKPKAPKPEGDQPEAPAVEEPPKPAEETREQKLAKLTKQWRPEHREFLTKQPPEVQDFLVGRQAEMDAAFTRKTQAVAYLQNEYGPIHEMLAPDFPAMKAAGYTPRMLIEGWANAEKALLSGPQQAAATLRHIAEGYQIPRELIARMFGFDPRTPDQIAQGGGAPPQAPQDAAAAAPNGNGQFRDPRVDLILAERQDMQERAVIARNQQFRNAAHQAQAAINAFRDETDAKGNLLHPHFAEVEGHMTALAKFHGESTGKIPPLKELYESAVQANPATRAKLIADAQRAQSEKARQAEAARGKADQARKAASSVVGSGRPGNRTLENPQKKGAGIRASIDAAFDQVMGDQE